MKPSGIQICGSCLLMLHPAAEETIRMSQLALYLMFEVQYNSAVTLQSRAMFCSAMPGICV